MWTEDECEAPVIILHDTKLICNKLAMLFETATEANIGAYLVRYQSIQMKSNETVLQFVNCMREIENRFAAVGHVLTNAEKKIVLLQGLRQDFAVTVNVIRATENVLSDAIGLLVAHETENKLEGKGCSVKQDYEFQAHRPDQKKIWFFL